MNQIMMMPKTLVNVAESREVPRDPKQNQRRCRKGQDPDAENTISTSLLAQGAPFLY